MNTLHIKHMLDIYISVYIYVITQARIDNMRILLYPERTLLMNEPNRIKTFQETGSLVKQAILQRREKWYN